MSKIAENIKEAWDIQHKFEKGVGWIQWKGTDVCMDIHCKCGYHSHIDATFAYHVQCPMCKRSYFCNGHIELIEVEEKPENCLIVGDEDLWLSPDVLIVNFDDKLMEDYRRIQKYLTDKKLEVEIYEYPHKIKKQMTYAKEHLAQYALLADEYLLKQYRAILKNVDTGEQKELPLSDIFRFLHVIIKK